MLKKDSLKTQIMPEASTANNDNQPGLLEQISQETPHPETPIGEKLQSYTQNRLLNQQNQVAQQQINKTNAYDTSESKNNADKFGSSQITSPIDPNKEFRPMAVNAKDFERYYEHPLYSKLGFDPFRDNEKEYNEKSTGWQDFERMSKQWGGLAMVGLKDVAPWVNPFSLTPNIKSSDEMARLNAIGTSTRPGAAASLTNFALSTGWIAGMLGEATGEELALAGATVLSGGLDIPLTSLLMGKKALQTSKDIAAGFDAIKDINTAHQIYDATKATGEAAQMTKEALGPASQFLMDFAKTKTSASDIWKTAREIRYGTAMATLSGADSYTKVKDDLYQQYNQQFGKDPDSETASNIESRAQSAANIDTKANLLLILATNRLVFPTVLKGMMEVAPRTAAAMAEEGTRIIGGEFDNLGKRTFERVSNYSFKGLADALKPVNLAKQGLKYTLQSVGVGTLMNGMDAITNAATDYYEQPNLDPSLQGHKSYLASMLTGVKSQLSEQGAKTFESGFFMKAALDLPQHLVFNKMIPSIYKGIVTSVNEATKPKPPRFPKPPAPDIPGEPISAKASADYDQAKEKYKIDLETFKNAHGENPSGWWEESANKIAEHEKAKDQYKRDTLNAYNLIGTSPIMAINAVDRNYVKQREGQQQVDNAMLTGNKNSAMDSQQEAMFHHIKTLLDAGQEGLLRDHIKALDQMNGKDLANAFDVLNPTPEQMKTIKTNLASFGDNIDKIKAIHTYYNENIPNPYSAYPTKGTEEQKATERIFNNYIEHAKMIGMFGRYDFDNTLDRMSHIVTDMEKIKPVTKAPFTDFKLLFDTDARKHEIEALKNEIEIDQEATDSESKRQLKQKQDKLSALVGLHNNILDHQESFAKGQEEVNSTTKDMYINYKRYIQALASNYDETILHSNINNTFESLKNFFAAKDDHNKAARAVNILSDPNYIGDFLKRAEKVRDERKASTETNTEENKTQENRGAALDNFLQRKEKNDFMNTLYDHGAYISPGDIDDLINNKKIPHNFYDVSTYELIKPDSDKIKKILNLVDIYNKVKTKPNEPTKTPESTSNVRAKSNTDIRKQEDLAKQYGFDTTRPTQVSIHKVLGALIASNYSTLAEKTLAQRLSSLVGANDNINFTNSGTSPGSYSLNKGITIDTRYSSDNFKGGVTPIEANILRQVLSKILTEGLSKDSGSLTPSEIKGYLQKVLNISSNSPALEEAVNLMTTKIDQAFATKVPGTTKTQAEVQPSRSKITSKTTIEQLPPELKYELVAAFKQWNSTAASDIQSDISELSNYEIPISGPFKRWYLHSNIKDQIVAKYNASLTPELITKEEPKQEIIEPSLPPGAGKAEPTIIAGTTVLEHGEDTATAQDKENGVKDTNLVEKGKKEARQIGEWAKHKGITAIEASDVERAQQTAHIAADIAGVLVKTNPHLGTWNIGEYDGKPEGTFNEKQWITSNEQVPGGEKFSDFTDRMQLAYQDALLASPNTLMITHSKVTRALDALKQIDGIWTDKTTSLFIGEKEASSEELHPSYEGKIVYFSPGTGKSTFAKTHPNIIDGDDIIVDVMKQRPGYDKLSRVDLLKTQRDPVTDNKIKAKLKELAAEGNTVLIGTTKYIDIADKVFTSNNDKLLLGRFKTDSELDKFKKRESDALKRFKKTPQEFSGYTEEELSKPLYEGPQKPIFAEAELEKSIQERIDNVKDMADLQDITLDVISQLRSGIGEYDYRTFDKMLAIKQAELSRKVNFDDIKPGDILIMKNKNFFGPNGRGVVYKKSDTKLEILAIQGDGRIHWVTRDNVDEYIDYQTKKVISAPIPEPTPEEIILLNKSKETMKSMENSPEFDEAIKKGMANPKDSFDGLFDETEC